MDGITCPVCNHNVANGGICPQCGYDRSCDYEQYPTLGKIPAHSISRMHRCRQLLQSQLQAEYDKKTQQLRKELEQEKARCASLESKLQALSEQNRTPLAMAQRKEQSQAAEIEKLQKDALRHPADPTEKGKTYGVSPSSSGHNTQKKTTTNLFGTGEAYYWGRECAVNYNKAFEYYTKAAAQGSTEALNRLGDCYAYGRGTEKSYAKAYDFYCRAAYKGLAEAQFNLGNCFYYGRGISKNPDSAVKWYQKAAAQDYQPAVKALNQLRNNLPKDISQNYGSRSQSTGGNTQKSAAASQTSNRSTQKNTTTNLYGTGEAYYWGRECAVNYNKAFEYYTKAAAQGSTEALNRLGDCYAYGRGTEKSYAKAYDFYCRAAYKGLAEAQFNLGNCFYYGRGISKNLNSAERWYKAAAAQNYQSAIKALNQIRNNLPKDISRNYGSRSQSTGGNTQKSAASSQTSNRGTQKNTAANLFDAGEAYYWGRGCAVDYNKAMEYYTKAAAKGSAEAINRLGNCCAYGRGTAKNVVKAFDYYCSAALDGLAEAQFNLGNCYYYGNGTAKNLNSAERWYKAAAAQNYQPAVLALNPMRNNVSQDSSMQSQSDRFRERLRKIIGKP